MNIFVLDKSQLNNVQYYIDAHVIKQVLETAQILCTVRHSIGDHNAEYRATHIHHPCTIWAGQSSKNYEWLCELGLTIAQEYSYRYGKDHKSADIILDCYNSIPDIPGELTDSPTCMADKFIISNSLVDNYRNYYINDKVFDKSGNLMAKWTKRSRPDWFIDKYGVFNV
jgi:hypothetical protein